MSETTPAHQLLNRASLRDAELAERRLSHVRVDYAGWLSDLVASDSNGTDELEKRWIVETTDGSPEEADCFIQPCPRPSLF